jgi:cell wall-associated NlpC family hydrolase
MKAAAVLIILLCMAGQSCIYVVHDKAKKETGSFTSVDSSKALKPVADSVVKKDSVVVAIDTARTDTVKYKKSSLPANAIDTKNVKPQDVIQFAQSLTGTPYRYASTDPKVGFDCSGFITYVFKHFGIIVPRSSIDFTNVGKSVDIKDSRAGDLVLFTGTDSTERFVGHMGIIVSNENGDVNFIHSTSGKKYGVTTTVLNNYYRGRYMKTVRIFP